MKNYQWALPLTLLAASLASGAFADDKDRDRDKDDVRVERHWEDRDGRRMLDHRDGLSPREQIERERRHARREARDDDWRDREHRDRDWRDRDDAHRSWRDRDDRHARRLVPPGHLPPPGECRIWFDDRPPGHQPPPGDCRRLRRHVPDGARLIRG